MQTSSNNKKSLSSWDFMIIMHANSSFLLCLFLYHIIYSTKFHLNIMTFKIAAIMSNRTFTCACNYQTLFACANQKEERQKKAFTIYIWHSCNVNYLWFFLFLLLTNLDTFVTFAGIEAFEFLVHDPYWLEKQECIMSLDMRYEALWSIRLK